jgi:hypothetical protein
LVKSNDPARAAAETSRIKGNKNPFLIALTDLFSESIVSHAFTGSIMISFSKKSKNLLFIKIRFECRAKLSKFMVYCFTNGNEKQ